jgi:8-oxo-dGTP pyrophosphatase MutT (NUDIX family)
VLAPLYVRDGVPCLLFTLRSLDLPKHRGEISFPGGSRDADDASLEWTALREAHEEIGLDPQRVEVLGPLPTVYAAVSNFVIQPYVGWLGEGLPPLAPNSAEVAEVIEAPLAALAEPEIYHSELWRRAGTEHVIHFYDFGAYRIWGATGRMLYSLLALLPAEAAA